jgi:Divergent InlB B-repeat domain
MLTVVPATAVLTLTVAGNGSVSPNLDGQSLIIGQTYSIVASPTAGNLFSGWSGAVISTDPTLSFVMHAGMTLEAKFTPGAVSITPGAYCGLFYESSGAQYQRAGLFAMTVADKGTFKGTLQIGANRYVFRQQLNQAGHVNATANCAGQIPLAVELHPDPSGSGEIVNGTVANGTWAADSMADRASGTASEFAGKYSVPLPDPDGTPSNSFATAKVNKRGILKLKGKLADGRRVRQRATVAKDGTWPLYLPVRGGALIGWMRILDVAAGSVEGDVLWLPATSP